MIYKVMVQKIYTRGATEDYRRKKRAEKQSHKKNKYEHMKKEVKL